MFWFRIVTLQCVFVHIVISISLFILKKPKFFEPKENKIIKKTTINIFFNSYRFDNLFRKDKFQPNSFSSYIDNYSKQNRFKRLSNEDDEDNEYFFKNIFLDKMEKTKFNETTAKHSDSDYYESSETTYQTIINLNTMLSSTSESTKRISSTLSLTSSILSMYNDSNLNALLSIITIG